MRVLEIRMEDPPPNGSTDYPVSVWEHDTHADTGSRTLVVSAIPQQFPSLSTCADLLLEQAVKLYRERGGRSADLAEDIGATLRDVLGGVWDGAADLERCSDCGKVSDEHLRIYFNIRAERLAALPWELLIRGGVRAFAPGNEGHTCLRGVPPSSPAPVTAVRRPLPIKVLVIAGSALPEQCVEEEVHAVQNALAQYPNLWHVNVMRSPTQSEVAREFRDCPPDVLHLIGHSPDAGGMEVGPTQGDAAEKWRLSPRRMADLMPPFAPGPRLVLLNTCNSFWMIPQEWLNDRADRIVIAANCGVDGKAAAEFARRFYDSLVGSCSVAESVRRARYALVTGTNEGDLDWGVPVVYATGRLENALPHALADLRQLSGTVALDVAEMTLGEQPRNPRFDQLDEHRELWRAGTDSERFVTIVTGAKDSGKTTLVTSCMTTWLIEGRAATYVDMLGSGAERIPLGAAAARIRRAVAALLRREEGVSEGPDQADADAAALESLAEDEVGADDMRPLIALLGSWPRDATPLILVMDHVEMIADPNNLLVKYFFEDIARRRVNARVIAVSAPPAELPSAVVQLAEEWPWRALVRRIELRGFAPDAVDPMFRELAARWGVGYDPALELYIESDVRQLAQSQPVSPGALINCVRRFRNKLA